MSDETKDFLETLVTAPTLAKKLGVTRMLINKLKKKKVLEVVIVDRKEFYQSLESILKFREYYKKNYPNSSINNLDNSLKITNLE